MGALRFGGGGGGIFGGAEHSLLVAGVPTHPGNCPGSVLREGGVSFPTITCSGTPRLLLRGILFAIGFRKPVKFA